MNRGGKLFIQSVIVVVLMVLAGCSSSDSGSDQEIPEGATVISDETFDDLLASGDMTAAEEDDQTVQAAEIETRFDEDQAQVDRFLETHPDAVDPRPGDPNEDVEDGSVDILPDGNVRHTITLNDGSTRDVVTLGRKNAIHSIAEGIRVFPTRDNQVDIYRRLYEAAPEDLRRELELVDPAVVEEETGSYDVEKIEGWNAQLVVSQATLVENVTIDPDSFEGLFDCGNDMGTDEDSDRSGCDPSCGFQGTGIYSHYTWNHKGDLSCVKDQGPTRGTCCAFSVVSATEYWVKRRLGLRVNLSEQGLYNRMTLNWVRNDLYDGYYISDALDYAISEGFLIYFENQWNYNPSLSRVNKDGGGFYHSCDNYADTCSNTTHQSEYACNSSGEECGYYVPEKNPNSIGYRLKSAHVIWDYNDPETSFYRVILYLALGDAVIIQVPVLKQFDDGADDGYVHYISGDVDDPATPLVNECTNRGNHIMHVVSFISNETLQSKFTGDYHPPNGSGGGYLIVKNSWSNCWGDGGYVYLPYDFVKEYGQYGSVLTKIFEE